MLEILVIVLTALKALLRMVTALLPYLIVDILVHKVNPAKLDF
jgi:hypothetical protein